VEAQFRIALLPGVPASAWNPANDPSFIGLATGGQNTAKSDTIPVYDAGICVCGRDP
jgi:hypothetical protein